MKKFANGFARLVFGLFVVMTAPAWALGDKPMVKEVVPKEVVPKEVEVPVKETASKDVAALTSVNPKCKDITLTGEKFLDMFYAIATHGDLTDVLFIEKTLQSKFEVKYSNLQSAESFPYKRAEYVVGPITGAPIGVSLVFDVERDPRIKIGFIAMMRISNDMGGMSVFTCLGLTPQDIEKKFGGDFMKNSPMRHDGHGMPIVTKEMSGSTKLNGKDGSTIVPVYSATEIDGIKVITGFVIKQDK